MEAFRLSASIPRPKTKTPLRRGFSLCTFRVGVEGSCPGAWCNNDEAIVITGGAGPPVTYEACDYYAGGQLALRMTANEQVV